ncbi:hypothetical protein CY34DRAFT_798111 [Suillus luteus UH-Slu-Lm8-n1]|uniref:Uncharacterized protein n=1 Tax=Suillus luteus UH-Slu-Lm8-n1 TaxID=930992 RepID=A0A0D0AEC9_9AGAM|nr:hypothetical protein CY34DRAFT_798111 [Suillus luteus UH-Slu-Lm8-n1]
MKERFQLRSTEMHHSVVQTMVVPTFMGYQAWWYCLSTSQSFSHLRVLRTKVVRQLRK